MEPFDIFVKFEVWKIYGVSFIKVQAKIHIIVKGLFVIVLKDRVFGILRFFKWFLWLHSWMKIELIELPILLLFLIFVSFNDEVLELLKILYSFYIGEFYEL